MGWAPVLDGVDELTRIGSRTPEGAPRPQYAGPMRAPAPAIPALQRAATVAGPSVGCPVTAPD